MAVKSAYYGSMGPFEYESTTTYADGKRFKGFRGRARLEGDADDAPLNIETLVAPSSPEDGDIWVLTTGMYARVNGVTILVTGASGSVAIGNTLSGDVTATFEADGDTPVTIPTSVISTFGRTLTDDADAATARTTLGLGTIATQNANNVAITGGTINGTSVGATTKSSGGFTTITNGSAAATSSTNFLTDSMVAGNVWTNSAWVGFKYTGLASTEYAIMQSSGGATVINCKTGTDIKFLINNVQQAAMTSSGNWNLASGKVYQINGTQIGLSTGLAGVLVSTPSAGHMLLYDDSDSRFENVAMSGDATITKAGVISLAAGLSNKSLYTNATQVGNVLGGEDDLMTYTVPAGTLANNKERLVVKAMFDLDTGGANTLKMYWNGVAVYNSGSVTPSSQYLWLEAEIIRSSATTQLIFIRIITASTTHTERVINTNGAATLSGAVVVKFTGEDAGGTSDDVVQNWMSVDYIKTN